MSKTLVTSTRDFPNNQLVQELFGEHNSHLNEIEALLGVRISARGNHLTLSGQQAEQAACALDALYRRLEKGLTVTRQEVAAAVRMADGDSGGKGDRDTAIRTRKKVITPRSCQQAAYIDTLARCEMAFGIGPAGTGKTYLAVAKGVEYLLNGVVSKIILSRPAVEAGEQLGFLPGDLKDKIDPYLRPLYDALYDTLPAEMVTKKLETGEIEIAPLAFMRGRTLSDAFVILDEAQNATNVQMKMFLTRMGEGARVVVTGDPSQVDLPAKISSGLLSALRVAEMIPEIGIVYFSEADVVRHPLVAKLVAGYTSLENGTAPR